MLQSERVGKRVVEFVGDGFGHSQVKTQVIRTTAMSYASSPADVLQVREPAERSPLRGRQIRLYGRRKARAPVEEASGGGGRGSIGDHR